MIKLVALDLDGTIAPIDCAPNPHTVQMLYKWVDAGVTLAIVSGKNLSYLEGFVRAIGLYNRIAILAENGCLLLYKGNIVQLTQRPAELHELESLLKKRLKERIQIQNNCVALSFLTKDVDAQAEAKNLISQKQLDCNPVISIYYQPDGWIDMLPANCNKGIGLSYFIKDLGISVDETVAAGDAANDAPMRNSAGVLIDVSGRIPAENTIVVRDVSEMLYTIDRLIERKV